MGLASNSQSCQTFSGANKKIMAYICFIIMSNNMWKEFAQFSNECKSVMVEVQCGLDSAMALK